MKLFNESKKIILAEHVTLAHSFFSRAIGNLGRQGLDPQHALWLKPCNNVHTWFMKFNLDLIFVDFQLRVVEVRQNVPPWRLLWVRKAYSVFEFETRESQMKNVEAGDQLHVGD